MLETKLLRKTGISIAVIPGNADRGPKLLSFAQESLWFIDQFAPNSSIYNIPHVLRLKGALNIPVLQKSIEWILSRHDSLRSSFASVEGKPMQAVADEVSISLSITDLHHLSGNERKKEARRHIDEESIRPFNLSLAPLLRASLIKLDADEHILMLTKHHIVSDLWSFQVFYRELTLAYDAFNSGGTPLLPPLKRQFQEYAVCQRQRTEGVLYQEQLAYWKEQLAGELPMNDLPSDRPRPTNLSFEGRRRRIEIPLWILTGVREFSRKHNVTLFVTLMATFQTLLHRYSNQRDVVVGSPMSGRMEVEAEAMIGLLINTLPIRTNFEGDPTFVEVVDRVKRSVFGALTHQEVPIEKLIDDLKIPRKGARNPLFQTVFQFAPDMAPALQLSGVMIEPLEIELGTSKFEITMTLTEAAAGLVGDIEYSTELFDETTIERIVVHFETLLQSILANPNQKVSLMRIMPAAELETVTKTWNNTRTSYPRDATIPQLFEEQVANNPDAIAIIFENQRLTYSELNRRANRLSRHLQKLGVGPDTMVGFCVERSLEMIVGILGILKAGGAYVTIDPNSSRERLAYMFQDTQSPVFVTTNKFRELASPGSHIVCVDEPKLFLGEEDGNPPSAITADNLAYVIYTSGSTGKPKGVLIPHRGVVRLVKETNYLRFSPDDVFLQFATISFDASTLELWGPLLNGGKLVIFPPHFDSIEQLGQIIRENAVTTLWLTAGLFHEMVDHRISDLKGVRYLLAGGDVLSAPHVVKALHELPGTELINGYGPTESTTFTCCYRVPKNLGDARSVPIGAPISNTQVYILSEHFQPAPIGMAGELFIGGDGLAREYLNAPDLTSQKFVLNPFSAEPGARLYRTGDRARWLPDGNVEFLGRLDTQVKVRGFRIELSEVESALATHPSVQQCIMSVREDSSGTRQLVAYVIFKPDASKNPADLREFLGRELPAYMVPSAFVALDAFPLNANGKVDRRKLPDPTAVQIKQDKSVDPANVVEVKIAQIWAEVLGISPPGSEENFFELGGHSLLATRVISRVNSAFASNLPLRALFEGPTVSGLAKLVVQNQNEPAQNRPMVRRNRRLREETNQSISEKKL
ncbi:MAG: amino acid adenylation domain-containing protein [Verrucomicrobia bacterium]|nr:amino acid adenylation domain-containing protein [Verrucomicrobiota bacterium]